METLEVLKVQQCLAPMLVAGHNLAPSPGEHLNFTSLSFKYCVGIHALVGPHLGLITEFSMSHLKGNHPR